MRLEEVLATVGFVHANEGESKLDSGIVRIIKIGESTIKIHGVVSKWSLLYYS